MKIITVITYLLSLGLIAQAQLAPTNKPPRVLLTWWANPEPDIAGYKVYQGTFPRIYDTVHQVANIMTNGIVSIHHTNLICSNFIRGVTYYFAATAYSTVPLESDFSEEVTITISTLPEAPKGLKVTNVVGVVTIQATLLKAIDPTGPWKSAMIVAPYYEDPKDNAFYKMMIGIDMLEAFD
jgi:hypothetical protein